MRIQSGLVLFSVLLVVLLARGLHALLGSSPRPADEAGTVSWDAPAPGLHATAWLAWPDGGDCLCEVDAPDGPPH